MLGAVVNPLRILWHVLGYGLVEGRSELATNRSVNPLCAREDDATDVKQAGRLEHVHRAHDVDLDAQRRIERRHGADEGSGMNDVRDTMPLDDVEKTRQIEDVACLEIDAVQDIANQAIVAMAGKNNRLVTFADKLPTRFGADHTHAAGNQNFHLLVLDGVLY